MARRNASETGAAHRSWHCEPRERGERPCRATTRKKAHDCPEDERDIDAANADDELRDRWKWRHRGDVVRRERVWRLLYALSRVCRAGRRRLERVEIETSVSRACVEAQAMSEPNRLKKVCGLWADFGVRRHLNI